MRSTFVIVLLTLGAWAAEPWDCPELGEKEVFLQLGDQLLPLVSEEIDAGRLRPGPPREGLSLCAIPIRDRRPAAGECMPFFLVLLNRGVEAVAVYARRWDLTAIEADRRVRRLPRRIGLGPEGVRRGDFIVVPPGGLHGELMDARDGREDHEARELRLYLEIGVPADAPGRHPERLFSGRDVLVSGAIVLPEEARPPVLDAAARRLLVGLRAEGIAALAERREDPAVAAGLLAGLDHADPELRRMAVFGSAVVGHPDADGPMLSCLASWGPRPLVGLAGALLTYLKGRPRRQRLAFLRRAVALTPHQRDEQLLLARSLRGEDFLPERDLAARLMLRHLPAADEPVDVDPGSLQFCAWQCYAGSDPELRDDERAAALMHRVVDAGAPAAVDSFCLALIEDDRQRLAELEAGLHGMDLNNLAWKLSYEAAPDRRNLDLAMRLAERSLEEVDPDERLYVLDTIAAVHACRGDMARALEYQRSALGLWEPKRDPSYLRRYAKYLLLRNAPEAARRTAAAAADSFLDCDPAALLELPGARRAVESAAAEPPVPALAPVLETLLAGGDPDEGPWRASGWPVAFSDPAGGEDDDAELPPGVVEVIELEVEELPEVDDDAADGAEQEEQGR